MCIAGLLTGFCFVLVIIIYDQPNLFLALLVLLLTVIVVFCFWRRARRYAVLSAAEVSREDSRAPVLLLRSFEDDEIKIRSVLFNNKTLEEDIASCLAGFGPIIAIGSSDKTRPPIGAVREYLDGNRWRDRVLELARQAQAVFMIMGKTEGLRCELGLIQELNLVAETYFVIPPLDRREILERWLRFTTVLGLPHGVGQIERFGVIMKILSDSEAVVYTSRSRREGDYFEATRYALGA